MTDVIPTDPNSEDAKTLDRLLDLALDLDEEARADFLDSAIVPAPLREELAALLRAATTTGALDRLPSAVTALQAGVQDSVKAGQRFGHYRLLRLLGEGGMASVWLAERDDLGYQVAVKCLKTGLASEEGRARFLREQRFLAQLQHPHIARLYDVGISDDGVPFIVMEWVDGVAITRYCDERKLGIAQRLRLFRKICAVVAYAHQNLVVHRDLKPANILVGVDDGEPKLLDFGIAKLLDESTEAVTRTGTYLLTPEYAAPEQFNDAVITTATDIYALGAILYELLSGLRPRPRQNRYAKDIAPPVVAPSEALRRLSKKSLSQEISASERDSLLAERRATTPDRLRRALQGDLETIVLKALQQEPGRRYATAQAFSEDIERYLQRQPIQARKDTWTYRTSKYFARHALGATLSFGVAATLVAATIVSVDQARRAEIQTQRAHAEALRAETETARAHTEAQRATAVKEFLTDLFEVSDTGMPRDQVPTTEILLQDGAKRIGDEFNDLPEIKFDLLFLLGSIQRHYAKYDQAESLLMEAKTIAEANFSPSDERWLRAQTEWTALLAHKNDYKAALSQITTAIDKYSGNKESAAWIEALSAQGNAFRRLDRFDEAVAVLREALLVAKRTSGEPDAQVATILDVLGRTLLVAKRYNEADAVLRENVALRRKLYGEDNAKYAMSLVLLADHLTAQDKNAEAETVARQALAIFERAYSDKSVVASDALYRLGYALSRQEKWGEAEATYKRIAALQAQLGQYSPSASAAIDYHLARIYRARGQYREAERRIRQYLASSRKIFGPKDSRVAQGLHVLVDIFYSQKKYAEAIPSMLEALEIERAVFGANSKSAADSLYNLGLIELAAGRPQPALDHEEQALRVYTESLNLDIPELIDARLVKASALNRLRRHMEAKELLVPLIADMRKTNSEGVEHDLADGLIELGRAHSGLGETANALANWNEALALQHTKQPLDKEEVAELKKLINHAQE